MFTRSIRYICIFFFTFLLFGCQTVNTPDTIIHAPKLKSFSGEIVNTENLPRGNYSQTCEACFIYGNDLQCTCSSMEGKQITSKIPYKQCQNPGNNLQNCDGILTCTPSCRSGIEDNTKLPKGSYLKTCTNCKLTGKILICTCAMRDGLPKTSGIDFTNCEANNDLKNNNGKLVCEPKDVPNIAPFRW